MIKRIFFLMFVCISAVSQSQGLKGTGLPIGKIGLSKTSGNISDVGLDNPPSGYDTSTVAYRTRVEADGGTVIDISSLNSSILTAKAGSWYDSVAMWYEADFGIKKFGTGDSVSKWYSVKVLNNDAVQTTALKYSFWKADSLNGKPTVYFNGTSSSLTYPTNLFYHPGQTMTVFMIIKIYGGSAGMIGGLDACIRTDYGGGILKRIGKCNVQMEQANVGVDMTSTDDFPNSYIILEVVLKSGASEILFNGNSEAASSANLNSYAYPEGIGCGQGNGGGCVWVKGNIAGIIIVKATSTTTRTLIRNYANSKYSLY